MNRDEAIKKLLENGKRALITELVNTHAERAQASFSSIRDDRSASQDYQRWLMAMAYAQTNRSLTESLISEGERLVVIDRDDAATVFGVKGLPGDAASLVISQRDAADRVDSTESADLGGLLERATRTGDEVLARAIAERAVREQKVDVMTRFLADRPALDAAGERLWERGRARSSGGIEVTLQLMAMRPQEFGSLSSAQIEDYAENNQGAFA